MFEKDKLDILRHSASHVLAHAVKKIYSDVKLGIGPPIENGFYYDFDLPLTLSDNDLIIIEEKMREIIKNDYPIVREEKEKNEAKKFLAALGENYKLEILEDIKENTVSFYRQGDFIDLCTGPHVKSTGEVKYFKLIKVSGAYWKGNEKNKMLQRVYGTAFFTKEELDRYLLRLEEAKRRDHRVIGKDLRLFNVYDESGAGLVYWLPEGAIIRRIIEDLWYKEHQKRGYKIVYTPHIARINLWERSGHLDFYKEYMYSPIDIEGIQYLLKPMNCPGHILIFKSQQRSYRELPLRFAELGTVYRYERSGVLHGLLRVRGFTQDDAHIFCTPQQLEDEMMKAVDFAFYLLKIFGFNEYKVFLATRPEKFAGSLESWNRAESTLSEAMKNKNIDFEIDRQGAVFYGPKIDVKIKDAVGREWQGPTIQFDFNLPEKFNVCYIGEDGKEHLVYMVHRALLGSFERFFGCLIEHYAGSFPTWLSPIQIIVLPINSRNGNYANFIYEKLLNENFRCEIDTKNEKLQAKIRDAQMKKIPYMIIVGDKEEKSNTVSIRSRNQSDLGINDLALFIKFMKEQIAEFK